MFFDEHLTLQTPHASEGLGDWKWHVRTGAKPKSHLDEVPYILVALSILLYETLQGKNLLSKFLEVLKYLKELLKMAKNVCLLGSQLFLN